MRTKTLTSPVKHNTSNSSRTAIDMRGELEVSKIVLPKRKIKHKIVRRQEIYWITLPRGVGSEQEGNRPVLIVSNDVGNHFSPVVQIVPLTLQVEKAHKLNLPTHALINVETGTYVALCEHSRAVDKSRLREKWDSMVSDEDMKRVEYAIQVVNGLI